MHSLNPNLRFDRFPLFAAFLTNPEGEFDWLGLIGALLMALVAAGGIVGLVRDWRRGQIVFGYYPTYGDPVEINVERKRRPFRFWLVFAFYCLGVLLFVTLCVGMCTGFLRRL